MNLSLDTANINAINISTLDFRIWQYFSRNRTNPTCRSWQMFLKCQLHSSTEINASEPIHSFTIKDDDEDSFLIWTILKHPGTYIGTIGMIFAVCIDVYCFKRFWIRSATPRHQPYSPISSLHAIVDDDVEAAPIYRHRWMVEKPIRPHRNHDLCIEWETQRLENHCKQPVWQKEFLYLDHWPLKPKSQKHNSSNGLL